MEPGEVLTDSCTRTLGSSILSRQEKHKLRVSRLSTLWLRGRMAGLAAKPVEVWVVRVQLVGGVVGAVACCRFLGLQLARGSRAHFAGN